MSFAADIAAGLAELRAELGVDMVYVRKSTGSRVAVSGVRTRPRTVGVDTKGTVVVSHDDDILLGADELIDGGSLFAPARNDRIEEASGTDLLIWETKPAAGNSRSGDVFYWSDAARTQARCHVQLVRIEHGESLDLSSVSAPTILQAKGLRWVQRFQYAGNSTQPLPAGVSIATGEILSLTVDHGDQRTITYFSGVDFTTTAGTTGSLVLSGLEGLTVGDWLHVINYGKPIT